MRFGIAFFEDSFTVLCGKTAFAKLDQVDFVTVPEQPQCRIFVRFKVE